MERKFLVLDVDYVSDEAKRVPIIRIFCLDEKGNVHVLLDKDYEPYFYVQTKPGKEKEVKEKILKLRRKEVKRVEIVEKKLFGKEGKFIKVVCDLPPSLSKVRDVIKQWEEGDGDVVEEYEYQLSFYRKYLIEKGISGMQWILAKGKEIRDDEFLAKSVMEVEELKPLEDVSGYPPIKVLAFDIETFEENGEQKIVMVSLFGKNLRKVFTYYPFEGYPEFVEVVANEKELLQKFVETIRREDPDFLVGYNSDMFDFQIIGKRAEKLGVELTLSREKSRLKFARRARVSAAKLAGRVHVDVFNFVNNILSPTLQTEVLTLDAVSAELLGDKKIEMEFEEILKAWREKKDLAKLAEYCLKDSELTFKLAELLFPQIFEICRVVGQLPFDVSRMTYGQLVEWYLSKEAFSRGEIIPNQPKWEEIQRRRSVTYLGGFVKEPIPGIHENIAVLDFRSLYPSIIATFNISPETLNCECCKGNGHKVPELGHWFCKKREGFVSSVVKELIERRIEVKKKLKEVKKGTEAWRQLYNHQYVLKIIANASYGYYGFPGAKWYSKECAESCTAFGRYFIKKAMEFAEKEGFTVVYGDTDSMFIKLKDAGKATREKVEEKVFEFLERINRQLPGLMELDFQGIYRRGIFIPRGVGPGTAKKKYALIDYQGSLLIRGLERVRRDWCRLAKETQESVLRFILEKNDVASAISYVRKVVERLREGKVSLKELTIHEQLTKPLEEYKAKGPHVVAAMKMKARGRSVVPGTVVMFVITKGKGSISERAEPVEDVGLDEVDEEYYIKHQVVPAALRILAVLGVREEQLMSKVRGLGEFLSLGK